MLRWLGLQILALFAAEVVAYGKMYAAFGAAACKHFTSIGS